MTQSEAAAKTDDIFAIDSIPLTTSWPGRTLLVLAQNLKEKEFWVDALQSAIRGAQSAKTKNQKPKLVLRLENPLDVNCVVQINEKVLLVGAKEGLFSYHGNRKELVKIEGVENVQQIVLVPKLSVALMIVGRQLVSTELHVLRGCADAVQCAAPTIEVEAVANCGDCHLFEVSETDDVFLCAAVHDRVKLFKWNIQSSAFVLRKELVVSEICSCIRFTEHSVLVGCDRFFQVDLMDNFSAEEFLDASDSSLSLFVFEMKKIGSFPVEILEVTRRRGETEFLLCYKEFGVFVDG